MSDVLVCSNGTSLLMSTNTALAIAPHFYAKIPFDPQKDVVPVCLVAIVPNVLLMHPSVPAGTGRQLIALAQTRSLPVVQPEPACRRTLPGNCSRRWQRSTWSTSSTKEVRPRSSTSWGGHIDLNFASLSSALSLVSTERLRPLAVTTTRHSSRLPQTLTMSKAGLPDLKPARGTESWARRTAE